MTVLVDPECTMVLSFMGVDGDALWRLDLASGAIDRIPMDSEATYRTLRPGRADRFVVVHHFAEGRRFEASVRRFSDPGVAIAQCH
jgi:hypothetical protein